MEITAKDDQLIALLRENGRLSVSEIARQLQSSRTAAQMQSWSAMASSVVIQSSWPPDIPQAEFVLW